MNEEITRRLEAIPEFIADHEHLFEEYLVCPVVAVSYYGCSDVLDYLINKYQGEYTGDKMMKIIFKIAAHDLTPVMVRRVKNRENFPDGDEFEDLMDEICEEEETKKRLQELEARLKYLRNTKKEEEK
jgi:hypothetical protein